MREENILAAARSVFMQEARDLLEQLEASLLSLADMADPELVNAAFRAAHTIKGSAGLFGFDPVVAFTHHVEALLELLRSHQLVVTDPIVTLLLECRDHIERLLNAVEGSGVQEDLLGESARLITLLRRFADPNDEVSATAEPDRVETQDPAAPLAPFGDPGSDVDAVRDDWVLHLRFGRETFGMGFDPLSFLRYLPTVGDVVGVECLFGGFPDPGQYEAEQCYLGVVVRLRSSATKREIEAVFDFVADTIELQILPPARKLDEMRDHLAQHADDESRLGELLLRIGALTPRELELALNQQASAAEAQTVPPRLGAMLVEQGMAPPSVVQAAVERQTQLRDKKSEEARFVRVQADKLDALIALIGELVISGSAAQILATRHHDEELLAVNTRLRALVEGARDRALQLRMVPIGETFARFKRVVHEVSRSLGKDVELSITGGDAELDKSMVDQIVDPLTHLVRNSLDHGLETPAERLASGKSEKGLLSLNAHHESGSIVIQVSDDGRGLSRERILRKAIERGLVKPDAEMTDAQVCDLIFMPGFSTAEQVTDLSGRGVGMDVVRRNIQALRGEVSLSSTPGRGSTVQIRLPLTLAIIDGFRVEVATQEFVVPLDCVVECIETPPKLADATTGCFHLRGEVLPILCLRSVLGLRGASTDQRSVLVMRAGDRKVGVLVDRLLGEHQTVIKPMGPLFRKLRGISGSTILGTGSVALILDMPALVARSESQSVRVPSAVTASAPSTQRRELPATLSA